MFPGSWPTSLGTIAIKQCYKIGWHNLRGILGKNLNPLKFLPFLPPWKSLRMTLQNDVACCVKNPGKRGKWHCLTFERAQWRKEQGEVRSLGSNVWNAAVLSTYLLSSFAWVSNEAGNTEHAGTNPSIVHISCISKAQLLLTCIYYPQKRDLVPFYSFRLQV